MERNANGVIHMDEGRNLALVIAFKGFDYEKRMKYKNESASIKLSEDLLAIL
jgi:hypothetical protein